MMPHDIRFVYPSVVVACGEQINSKSPHSAVNARGRDMKGMRPAMQDDHTIPSFNRALYYLGKVCKHGHDWQNTGRSLRRRKNHTCVRCTRLWNNAYQRTRPLQNSHVARALKVTQAQYDNWLLLQNGVCAICGKPPEKKRLSIDHDHVTGQIRGLLCSDCNFGISYLRDDLAVLEAAIRYLGTPRSFEQSRSAFFASQTGGVQ